MPRAFVIDDEGGDGYVSNVIDLLQSRGLETEHLETILEARKRLGEVLKSDLVVLDLMMPETDEQREIPEDPTDVGFGFLLDLTDRGFSGRVAVLTNATRERHGIQISRIEGLAKQFSGRISVTFKYVDGPIQFIAKLFSEGTGSR